MMKVSRSSEWRHQQKMYQNKGEFFQTTRQPQLTAIERNTEKIGKIKERLRKKIFSRENGQHFEPFDYNYDDGRVNVSTFVKGQFKMEEVCEQTVGLRMKAASNSLVSTKYLNQHGQDVDIYLKYCI